MAFNDKPLITDSARNSEESENFVRSEFNYKKGFITRKEEKDYGVDFSVELVLDSNATGFIFSIQVKSKKSITIVAINNKEYISMSLKTSRLGYLCSRMPAYGLVVLYDDGESKCYFDYVEFIYDRIMNRKQSEEWKSQEEITIHIPISNEIKPNDDLKSIHNFFSKRCMVVKEMGYYEYNKYDIPYFNPSQINISRDKIDLINQGYDLINRQEFLQIMEELNKISFGKIKNNQVLSFLAAITYKETGRFLEAEFFFKNCNRADFNYSNSQRAILNSTHLLQKRMLGKITHGDLMEGLKKLKSQVSNSTNFSIQLEILQWELNNTPYSENLFQDQFDQAINILHQIRKEDIDQNIQYLLEIQCAGYIQVISSRANISFSKMHHLNAVYDYQPTIDELDAQKKYLYTLAKFPLSIYRRIGLYAEKNDLYSLRSKVWVQMAKDLYQIFLSTLIDLPTGNPIITKVELEEYLDLLDQAGLFYKYEERLLDLYDCIRTRYNLREIGLKILGSVDQVSLDKDDKELYDLEELMGISVHHQTLLDDVLSRDKEPLSYKEMLIKMPNEYLHFSASQYARVNELPSDRIKNILDEKLAFKRFYIECNDSNCELKVDNRHLTSPKSMYSKPSTYIAKNVHTGKMIGPSEDIEEIIAKVKR